VFGSRIIDVLLRDAASSNVVQGSSNGKGEQIQFGRVVIPNLTVSRGTRVQISSWSLRLRFNLSFRTNRGIYHGYSCGGTSSSGGSAWRRLP
jgi:hypothetical protein